jgi:hypothetical protein
MGGVLLVCVAAARGDDADALPAGSRPAAPVKFLRDVYPIFQSRCLECHGPERAEGALRLDRHEFVERKGHTGTPLLGGDLDSNPIYLRVTSTDESFRMPKGGPPLSDEEISRLRRWVEQGTPWADPPTPRDAATPGYELTWENLPPWNPRDWSDDQFRRIAWWVWRIAPACLLVLVWIGACERARYWVATQHPRVAPPRGAVWRRLARTSRGWQVAAWLLVAVAGAAVFSQQQGRRADNEVRRLRREIAMLQTKLNPASQHPEGAPRPVRPNHPPRLGGEYYRGNDERNESLYNGGFYRTCEMRVWLCREDGSILAWGDQVDPQTCYVRFEIEQSPGATDALFTTEVMQSSYVSAIPPDKGVDDPARQIARFEPDGEKRWAARIPLDLTAAKERAVSGVLYVCRGEVPGQGGRPDDPHYAAEYSLRLDANDRLTGESELWMGYIFRTGNIVTVPEGMIAEDEWFSFRPIPEIEGGHRTTDPKLLGIDDPVAPKRSQKAP